MTIVGVLRATRSLPPLLLDDDFADLHHRGDVGVVGDVAQDLLGVRSKTLLEGIDRVGEDVAHADIGGGIARRAAGKPLVDRVIFAGIPQAGLHQRHMLVAIVVVVEAGTGLVGIHDAYLDHRFLRVEVHCLVARLSRASTLRSTSATHPLSARQHCVFWLPPALIPRPAPPPHNPSSSTPSPPPWRPAARRWPWPRRASSFPARR